MVAKKSMDPELSAAILNDYHYNGLSLRQIRMKYRIKWDRVSLVIDPERGQQMIDEKNRRVREKRAAQRALIVTSSYGRSRLRMESPSEKRDPVYSPDRDGPVFHKSLTSELCGDPLPGRSALDQRKRVLEDVV